MRICIVIPVYKEFAKLSPTEVASIKQCYSVLNKYSIFLAAPKGLDLTDYKQLFEGESMVKESRFTKKYFTSIDGYNKLLLSTAFYKTYFAFDYMLIYQLDAWVFKDELAFWCNKKYDYIGAPWINENVFSWINLFPFRMRWYYKLKYNKKNLPIVGNGGLSLRNVQACLSILTTHPKAAEQWPCYEDLFWSFYTIYKEKWFSIPPTKEAVAFAFEFNPEVAFELNNYQLPFGCHAWEKYNPLFWKKFIDNS